MPGTPSMSRKEFSYPFLSQFTRSGPVSNYIHDAHRSSVVPGRDLDSASSARCVDDLSIADVHGNMVDPSAAASVEDQSPGFIWLDLIRFPLFAWEPE